MHLKVGFCLYLAFSVMVNISCFYLKLHHFTATMMSPYGKRSGRGSVNQRASWVPVTAEGELRGSIAFEGSVRVKYAEMPMKHIKGDFVLERWNGKPTQYCISYNGFNAGSELDTAGEISLPRSLWKPITSKARSKNMSARLIMLSFDASVSENGLTQIQVTIPLSAGGHRAAKLVFEAFVAGDIEMRGTH